MQKRRVDNVQETSVNSSIPSSSPASFPTPRIITLTTDFGTSDYFVAAMKGVILAENRNCQIVDITHNIPPQDLQATAFSLLAVYRSFPAGTIHVAVVDPGVGSARAAIVVEAGRQFFVGPDNGIFSYVCEQELECRVVRISSSVFLKDATSATFHGRDLFAPVAAALSKGAKPEQLGEVTDEIVKLNPLGVLRHEDKRIEGRIIHIDNFGNCVTNLTKKDLPSELNGSVRLRVNGATIDTFKQYFAEDSNMDLFGIWGSAGFLEIATTNGSAATVLKVSRGDTVLVELMR